MMKKPLSRLRSRTLSWGSARILNTINEGGKDNEKMTWNPCDKHLDNSSSAGIYVSL